MRVWDLFQPSGILTNQEKAAILALRKTNATVDLYLLMLAMMGDIDSTTNPTLAEVCQLMVQGGIITQAKANAIVEQG